MSEVRVALVGIGNVASTLVQGIQFYGDKRADGLWHPTVGGYKASDIKIVSAFDIDATKVGLDISESIFVGKARKHLDVKNMNVQVKNGILSDNLPSHLNGVIDVKSDSYENVLQVMKDSKPDIVINLISSGLNNTTSRYAECALDSGASFVNATPAPITQSELLNRFASSGLMLVGDDLMSQFGGTAFHKGMIDFMVQRGVRVKKSYQLDVGGSMETLNTTEEHIKAMKRKIKTSTINSEAPYEFDSVAGTTEYTDFLNDWRVSYYWIYSEGFLNSPAIMDITLRTSDGANACNVLFDIARAIKYCKDYNKLSLRDVICSYGFKNPPRIAKIRDSYADFVKAFVS
ncbi:MAG: hypothetical protein QXU32_06200 [Nitrososphaerales archaeon]